MRCAEHVACMGNSRSAYKLLVGKPDRNHFEVLGIGNASSRSTMGGGDWIDLAQGRDGYT